MSDDEPEPGPRLGRTARPRGLSAGSPQSSRRTWPATRASWGATSRHPRTPKAHRKELVEPLIAEHRGRIVKLMGDGALCEFASAVDAVECAVRIQHGMAGREAEVPEAERSASASGSTSAT